MLPKENMLLLNKRGKKRAANLSDIIMDLPLQPILSPSYEHMLLQQTPNLTNVSISRWRLQFLCFFFMHIDLLRGSKYSLCFLSSVSLSWVDCENEQISWTKAGDTGKCAIQKLQTHQLKIQEKKDNPWLCLYLLQASSAMLLKNSKIRNWGLLCRH